MQSRNLPSKIWRSRTFAAGSLAALSIYLVACGGVSRQYEVAAHTNRLVASISISNFRALAVTPDRRTLYYFWNRKETSENVVSTIDLSDPYQPKRIKDSPIGRSVEEGDALAVEERLYFFEHGSAPNVRIFSLKDQDTPDLLATISNFDVREVSEGGIILAGEETGHPVLDDLGNPGYRTYETTDPSHPKASPYPSGSPVYAKGLNTKVPYESCFPEACAPGERAMDRDGALVVLAGFYGLRIRTEFLPGMYEWTPVETVTRPLATRLLDEGRLLLVANADRIEFYAVAETMPSADLLRRLLDARTEYAKNLAEYHFANIAAYPILERFDGARVKLLVGEAVAGLTTQERAELLYSYGYLISDDFTRDSDTALPALRKAAELGRVVI